MTNTNAGKDISMEDKIAFKHAWEDNEPYSNMPSKEWLVNFVSYYESCKNNKAAEQKAVSDRSTYKENVEFSHGTKEEMMQKAQEEMSKPFPPDVVAVIPVEQKAVPGENSMPNKTTAENELVTKLKEAVMLIETAWMDIEPIPVEIKARDNIKEVIAALLPSAPAGWMPIETAPKDENWFLGTTGGIPFVTCWDDDGFYTFNLHYENTCRKNATDKTWRPTHWMPLPAAPQPPEEQ